MTKMLSPLSLAATVAVFSVTLQAQTSTSPQASDPAMTTGSTQTATSNAPSATQQATPVQAASLTAELTKSIDTKKAKVGDEVNAKTTSDAKLPDGTALPKGTKLVGNIIDVTPKSKEQKNSHLVLSLNRAVTKDGQELPIRSAVTSMTAPSTMTAPDSVSPGGSAAMPSGGGSSAGAGGASAGASASPAPSAPMMADSGSQAQSTQGQMLKSAQDHVAVGNMPKVMLSAPTTPDSAGVLDAEGQNISLDSGTKLTLNVIPAKPGPQGVQ